MPKRIQMTRNRPWRAENPDAVIVDRRTRWGNPYRVVAVRQRGPFDVLLDDWFCGQSTDSEGAAAMAVRKFREAVENFRYGFAPSEIRADLAGKDLACWCKLGAPCHADVLLEIANGTAA
jgi:hypothetical protein